MILRGNRDNFVENILILLGAVYDRTGYAIWQMVRFHRTLQTY